MNKIFNIINKTSIVAALAVMMLGLASCERTTEESTRPQERVIVYAVGHEEGRKSVKDDAEWNALLDKFCSYAQGGSEVIFYNTATSQAPTKGLGMLKEATSFSTTSRDEMKAWMKDMEKAGKTVSVKYDNTTGTWSGTAYINAPHHEEVNDSYTGTLALVDMPPVTEPVISRQVAALVVSEDSVLFIVRDGYLCTSVEVFTDGLHPGDQTTLSGELKEMQDINGNEFLVLDISLPTEGSVAGEWRLDCIAVTEMGGSSDYMLSTTLYIPEAEGESISIVFRQDGTATYTATGANATSEDGTWSIDDDGMLCCSILPSGGSQWYINWLTNSTMIISRPGSGDDEGSYYQLQFEKI